MFLFKISGIKTIDKNHEGFYFMSIMQHPIPIC